MAYIQILTEIKIKGRTAILTIRPLEYPKRDLNPHSHHWPKDFKSFVSTIPPSGQPYGKSGKRDSNSRPRPWQGRALPTELLPHCFSQNGCKDRKFPVATQLFKEKLTSSPHTTCFINAPTKSSPLAPSVQNRSLRLRDASNRQCGRCKGCQCCPHACDALP